MFFHVWFAWAHCSHFMKGSGNISWICNDLLGFPWLSLLPSSSAESCDIAISCAVRRRGGMEHLQVCITAQVWHERRESKDKYFLLDFSFPCAFLSFTIQMDFLIPSHACVLCTQPVSSG